MDKTEKKGLTRIFQYYIINNCDVRQKLAYQSPGEHLLRTIESDELDFHRRLNHEEFYGQSSDN